jgi:hypothetical protein
VRQSHSRIMNGSVVATERQRTARCRLLEELLLRQLPGGGWGHAGAQFATEPTSWALLALRSFPLGAHALEQGLTRLMLHRQSDGLWLAVGDGASVSFWAAAQAIKHADGSRGQSRDIHGFT